ncbi:MAG: hypothetical protein KAT62_06395 [Desulfuromonadales bacterium]|nr:hypothetical protein [Desulfuromonadales bacterium]
MTEEMRREPKKVTGPGVRILTTALAEDACVTRYRVKLYEDFDWLRGDILSC